MQHLPVARDGECLRGLVDIDLDIGEGGRGKNRKGCGKNGNADTHGFDLHWTARILQGSAH